MTGSSSILEWIVAIATVVALLIAAWELRANAKISGQAHAREAWMRYLELGLQYPEYSSTEVTLKILKVPNVIRLWEKESRETLKYWWFFDCMMEACESLVNYFPEREWRNTIRYNLLLHEKALRFTWDNEKSYYSDKLNAIVTEVLGSDETPL